MSKKLLGIDLGGTTVKFGILTSEGEVQEKWAIETNTLENGRHIVPNIVESLKHRLEMYGLTAEDFIGIGMGSPGAVNRENKTVTGAFNLNWAETQEVGSVIEKELGIPFAIDNDANVAALGERWVGAGANNPDVVFVTLGTGVGGGVIADGNLIHGVGGAGGEIGHIIVEAETAVVNDAVKEALTNLAMQIAALNPKYVSRDEISEEYIAHEKEILLAQIMNDPKESQKPEKVINGMIEGRVSKELKEICLVDQVYVKAEDGKQTVAKYLDEVSKAVGTPVSVKRFVRFETGEGIEKKQEDFAAEVAAQMNA